LLTISREVVADGTWWPYPVAAMLAMRRNTRLKLWFAFGACAALAAGFAAWAAWPRPAPVPRARSYLNVTACLLTGRSGIAAGTLAAPVWASMQAASLATHVMVSYLPDTGPADVPVMLNTLIQRQCGVIITAGADPGQVIQTARANPRQRFLLVAGSSTAGLRAPPNAVAVAAVNAPSQISQTIHALAAAG
jgi:hypothetical protein